MQNFSLSDLAWIVGILLAATAWWMQWPQRVWARYIMVSREGRVLGTQDNEDEDFLPATTTPQPATTALQSGATNSNDLLIGQARALAAMVKAGKIGETEGIKLVFGVSPSSTNPKYQAARAALKSELEKLNNPYPNMTREQKQAREVLGLERG